VPTSKPRARAAKPPPDLDALLKYRGKRKFDQTPEPEAGTAPAEGDLTFVVQQHAATRMHWDFRLEVDGVLASWAVPRGPSLNTKDKRQAVHVEDHPYDYGGFEGVIAKGNYGAGQVIVWDNGTYTPDEGNVTSWANKSEGSARMREGIENGKISITMRGHKLRGSWTLVRIAKDPKTWLLIKHRDEYASETRDILEEDGSVLSGLSIQDLKEGRMPPLAQAAGGAPHADAREASVPDPRTLRPMLATLVEAPFSREGWLFEPKLDGVRALAFLREGKVDLRTRRGNQVSVQFPEVVEAVAAQPAATAIFDGEIVAINERGAPDFQELQPRINLSRAAEVARIAAETPAYYYLFDLLYLDGYDLRGVPLAERKELLRRVVSTSSHLKLVEYIEREGEDLYRGASGLGFEGIVAKRATSTYEAGVRSRAWLKMKDALEQEFVVGGYTEGEGSRSKTFGGLLVGYYAGDELRFASSVGSGLSDKMLAAVKARLQRMGTDRSPFANPPTAVGGRWSGGNAARCYWVKPELVARVKFAAWTREGNLRAPVFVGLRDDIDPRTVRREEAPHESVSVIVDEQTDPPSAGGRLERAVAAILEQLAAESKSEFMLDVDGVPIKLTNLDKVFWPATPEHGPRTKRELIRYYARVAPYVLPHLKDRPLTLTRYPNGIAAASFYQKHWPSTFPKEFRVERVSIFSSSGGGDGEYVLVNNLQTLIWLAQLADLEIHAWMARTNPEPDARGLSTVSSGSAANLDASVLNYPDYMIFDLDPYIYAGHEKKGDEPALNRRAFEKTREIAFSLKEVLEQLRLSSFVKTTGRTGLHVYVPVIRHYTYDQIRAASETIGRFMMQMHPDDLTMEWATQKRTGKIFFDHNQNTSGKTLAAQYSLRPSEFAGVSAPVTWEELKRSYPTDFDIDTVPARVERVGDLWQHILEAKQDLRSLLEA